MDQEETGADLSQGPVMAWRPRYRDRVEECLRRFREIYRSEVEEQEKAEKGNRRFSQYPAISTYTQLKSEGKLVNQNLHIPGPVSGVNIGDIFYHRMELYSVGVHRKFFGDVDSVLSRSGKMMAVSVVVSSTCWDDLSNPDELVYHVEKATHGCHGPTILEQSSKLALKNTLLFIQNYVRVIRASSQVIREVSTSSQVVEAPTVYIYKGLFSVESMLTDSETGYDVFRMKKVGGQESQD